MLTVQCELFVVHSQGNKGWKDWKAFHYLESTPTHFFWIGSNFWCENWIGAFQLTCPPSDFKDFPKSDQFKPNVRRGLLACYDEEMCGLGVGCLLLPQGPLPFSAVVMDKWTGTHELQRTHESPDCFCMGYRDSTFQSRFFYPQMSFSRCIVFLICPCLRAYASCMFSEGEWDSVA